MKNVFLGFGITICAILSIVIVLTLCGTVKLNDYVKKNYSESKTDLFAVFIEKCSKMTVMNGFQTMITQHSWMFISTYEKLRIRLQGLDTINMLHLGPRAFEEIAGEVVQTSSFVFRRSNIGKYKGIYFRLVDGNSQEQKQNMFLDGDGKFTTNKSNLKKIPGYPIAYWVGKNTFDAFRNRKCLREYVSASVGIQTGDNEKFIRLWWEIPLDKIQFGTNSLVDTFKGKKWFPYNKGGEYRKWYGNNEYIIDWGNDGSNIKENSRISGHHYQQYADNLKFKPLLTWSRISTGSPAFRYRENGSLSDMAGFSLYAREDDDLKIILGFCNSNVAKHFLSFLAPTLNFMIGPVTSMPFEVPSVIRKEIIYRVEENISLSKIDSCTVETSVDFQIDPLVRVGLEQSKSLMKCYQEWSNECDDRFKKVKDNETSINQLFVDLYKLSEEVDTFLDDSLITIRKSDLSSDIKGLISYAVGCIMGRFSLSNRGVVYSGINWSDNKYNQFIPDSDGIIPITDEDYFKNDIVGKFVEFVSVVFGNENLEENLIYIANALGNKGNSSRDVIHYAFYSVNEPISGYDSD